VRRSAPSTRRPLNTHTHQGGVVCHDDVFLVGQHRLAGPVEAVGEGVDMTGRPRGFRIRLPGPGFAHRDKPMHLPLTSMRLSMTANLWCMCACGSVGSSSPCIAPMLG
jgi:hypothetical protein